MTRLLALALALLIGQATALQAREAEFRRLRGDQLRARIQGRDITDDFHWTEYYERGGILRISDMNRRSVGRWKVERDQLCIQRRPNNNFECYQVWVRGAEISRRAFDGDQPHPAFIRRHEGG